MFYPRSMLWPYHIQYTCGSIITVFVTILVLTFLVERKSRFSSIKRKFTRTKEKKPRSHSIERSSGLDEHRYLDPNTSSQPIGEYLQIPNYRYTLPSKQLYDMQVLLLFSMTVNIISSVLQCKMVSRRIAKLLYPC